MLSLGIEVAGVVYTYKTHYCTNGNIIVDSQGDERNPIETTAQVQQFTDWCVCVDVGVEELHTMAIAWFSGAIAVSVVATALLTLSGTEARLGDPQDGLLASQWPSAADQSASPLPPPRHLYETTTVVPNQFIVRFSSDDDNLLDYDAVEQRAALVARLLKARILHVYHYAFSGVALEAHFDSNNSTSTRSSTTTPTVLSLTRAQEILLQAASSSRSSSSSSLFYAIGEVRMSCLCVDSG
jgi:hypothetical protein